jgi:hypothetical protein
MSLSGITKRETEAQRRLFSGLGVALVALLLVMLFSAFKRLMLYEEVYGFSRLRTYTHVFLVWIGLLLVVTIVLEILRKERMFTFAMLIASFGFAASLPVLNVDAFIVRQNIQREIYTTADDTVRLDGTERLDAQYFLDLSEDAVPELVAAYQNPSLPDSVHEKIGASLVCIRHERGMDDSEPAWQSFHFSAFNADRALALVKDGLKDFEVYDGGYPVEVTTPSGGEFPCSPYYYD